MSRSEMSNSDSLIIKTLLHFFQINSIIKIAETLQEI
jgi:hypothetical protein